MRGRLVSIPPIAVIVAVAAVALTASAADAGSIGRAKFIKRADSICQPHRIEAQQRIAHGVRLLQRKHPSVRRAGRHFITAYRELRLGYQEIAHLPRPFEFHVQIAKWLHREKKATATGVRSAIALKRKHFAEARRLSHRAAVLEQQAKRPVRNFDFEYCRPI
jgi:hypothetical protein